MVGSRDDDRFIEARSEKVDLTPVISTQNLDSRMRAALALLLQAHDFATQLSRGNWDFALEINSLRDLGLTPNDLRWLVCKGYVEHAREMRPQPGMDRRFRPNGVLTFPARTCFILSEDGVKFARSRGCDKASVRHTRPPDLVLRNGNGNIHRPVPQWDCDRRELRLGTELVKQFRLPSPNQETILTAFQEESWPPRIDDPLPQHPEHDAKQRLHDTIRSLNRNQKYRLVRFKGDGTGEGVLWEPFVSPRRHDQPALAEI
jgi:hypothetical protein